MANFQRPLLAGLCLVLSIGFAVSPLLVRDFAGFDPNLFPVPQDKPPVQPAGYAFGIWGLIYGWLILGCLWGLAKAPRDGQWHDMRWPLLISLGVGCGWLSVAVTSPIWASVLIWVMLLSALSALFLAPVQDRVWGAYPVGLYAGWLSAASCVSLGLLAAGYGWLDGQMAAIVFVALAAVVGATIQAALGRTPTYGVAVIWGLMGVFVANGPGLVGWVAAGGAALVALPTLRAMTRG